MKLSHIKNRIETKIIILFLGIGLFFLFRDSGQPASVNDELKYFPLMLLTVATTAYIIYSTIKKG